MHAIAPDFSFPFGGKSSPREEQRPGDDRFDALLRDEEARHARRTRPSREPREAERPARDDVRRDAPPSNDALRDKRVERRERPTDASVTETHPAPDHDRPAAVESDTAAPVATADGQTGEGQPQPAAAQTAAADSAGTSAVAAAVTAAQQFNGTQNASSQAAQSGVPTTASAVAQAPAAQPAGETAAATPETTAQPASGAAAAQRAADKSAPPAASKEPNQVAAAHRQSPSGASTEATSGSSPRDAQNAAQPTVVITTAATVEARPAGALGGAAATAALAQGAGGQTTASGDDMSPKAEVNQAVTGAKPAAQTGQSGKAPDVLAAMAEKPAGAGQPSTSVAGDSAGTSTGQPAAPTAAIGTPGTGPLHSTSFAETLASARHTPAANPAEQIAIQVQRAQVAGQEQINIKLHPAELGRIEVKLEHASDGTLRAVISAERPETLDLLQRDARGLERALQDAGVKTDSGSLNFNLRGQGQGQEQQAGGNGGSGRNGLGGTAEGADSTEAMPAPALEYDPSRSTALDIRV
ncbi:MAG: flagellar hook-length control protein FliK [Kiloniellaceae bacterium]